MKSSPVAYPSRQFFEETLRSYGEVTLRPLWGRTPFNNYLVVLSLSR